MKQAGQVYRLGDLQVEVRNGAGALPAGTRVTMAIRPEDLRVVSDPPTPPNQFVARVAGLEFHGAFSRLTLELAHAGPTPVHADLPTETARRLGLHDARDVTVELPPERIRVYEA